MASNLGDETTQYGEADGSENAIEIKIQTLEPQLFNLKVNKQMPVSELKTQIASVSGVLFEQQRLIFRGRTLEDDQLLSACHIEDGHTIHMVVRRSLPPSETALNLPETDPTTSTDFYYAQVSNTSLQSLPNAIPNSLSTLSYCLSHMRRDFGFIGYAGRRIHVAEESSSSSSTTEESFPTPASLAEVLLSTRRVLNDDVSECLFQLARLLQNHRNVADPAIRQEIQYHASSGGDLFNYLGAYLLELGRTLMALQMGINPSEAIVNSGPAIYISQSGHNPIIMVQPVFSQQNARADQLVMEAMHRALLHSLRSTFLHTRIGSLPMTTLNGNREEQDGAEREQPSSGPLDAAVGEVNSSGQGNARAEQGSHSSERQTTDVQSEQHTIDESVVEQQNVEGAARDG